MKRAASIIATIVAVILMLWLVPKAYTFIRDTPMRERFEAVEESARNTVIQHFEDKYGIAVEISYVNVSAGNDGAPFGTRRVTSVSDSALVCVTFQDENYYAQYTGAGKKVYDSYQSEEIRQAILGAVVDRVGAGTPMKYTIVANESTYGYATTLGYYMLAHEFYDGSNLSYFTLESRPVINIWYPAGTDFPENLEERADALSQELYLTKEPFVICKIDENDDAEIVVVYLNS